MPSRRLRLPPPLVDARLDGPRMTVALSGELDLDGAELARSLLPAASAGLREVVFDLGEVWFLDAAGLRLLLEAAERYAAAGCSVAAVRPRPIVARLLEATGSLEPLGLGALAPPRREQDPRIVAILAEAVAAAAAAARTPLANAQLLERDSGVLRLVVQRGFDRRFVEHFEAVSGAGSACAAALESGRAVWVSDVTRSAIFAGTESLEVMVEAGSRAVASVPVRSPDGELLGMVSAHRRTRSPWTGEERRALRRIARRTGRRLAACSPPRP